MDFKTQLALTVDRAVRRQIEKELPLERMLRAAAGGHTSVDCPLTDVVEQHLQDAGFDTSGGRVAWPLEPVADPSPLMQQVQAAWNLESFLSEQLPEIKKAILERASKLENAIRCYHDVRCEALEGMVAALQAEGLDVDVYDGSVRVHWSVKRSAPAASGPKHKKLRVR